MEKKPNEPWKLDKRDRLVIITRGISDQRLREICDAERDDRCLIIQSVHGISINDHSGDPVGDPGPIGTEMSYIEMAAELERCKSDLAKAEETLAMMMDMDYQQRVKTIFGLSVERVSQLVEADKDGRCFISNVKVGDYIFFPYDGEIVRCRVQGISLPVHGKNLLLHLGGYPAVYMWSDRENIDWWKTREAAKAALKGERDG